MKKRNLLLCIITALCLMLGVLTACGDQKSTDHTVTFTGEEVATFTQKIADGGFAVEPKDPVREGYTFEGWYKGGVLYVFSTPVTSDFTLTAEWVENVATTYTVTFLSDGEKLSEQTINGGETAMEPKSPVREGYTFEGWLLGESAYDFETPVTSDITLTASWKAAATATITGSGTAADPYVIRHALQMATFSTMINTDEDAASAYYVLDADIDMAGYDYTPAGKEKDEVKGFSGVFDGKGHTIKDLSISKVIRSGYSSIGLFGDTYMANIRNFTLENFRYNVESYSSNDTVGAYIGGVVGNATLTNFSCITVKGTIDTEIMAENTAYIGGIAGGAYATAVDGQAFIVYTENCFADLTTTIGEEGSLESAAVGGLYGYVLNFTSAMAIVNSGSTGKIYGGQFTGGLVGTANEYLSVIDCYSSANVEATATSVTYAGGLIGSTSDDCVILDSYATGKVKAKREATGSYYRSYVGGIVGYAPSDDYDYYFTAGTAVVNCYFSGTTNLVAVNQNKGTVVEAASINGAFRKDVLGWQEECWQSDTVRPTSTLAREVKDSYTVTLLSNGEKVDEIAKPAGQAYSLLGVFDELDNVPPVLFFGWELANGVQADSRIYLPVVKDMNITARWQDVTAVVGSYQGSSSLNGQAPMNAGSIKLDANGNMQWLSESLTTGNYIYDGVHIVFQMNNSLGQICGSIIGDEFTFIVDAGMTGDVAYTFTKYEAKLLGEFVADNGDILTFSNGTVSFQSDAVKNGDYVTATFAVDESGNITFEGKSAPGSLTNYYSSLSAKLNEDGSVTVNFVGDHALENVTFTSRIVSGEEIPFLGEYYFNHVSATYNYDYGVDTYSVELYRFTFRENGTVVYTTAFSSTVGRYYYFEDLGLVKVVLEGYASSFYYNGKVLYGAFNRGVTIKRSTVFTPVADGKLFAYPIGSVNKVLFVNDVESYLIDGTELSTEVTVTGNFKNGNTVTVNGDKYVVRKLSSDRGYQYGELIPVNKEVGTYTYGNTTVTLDGIGGVSGTKKGLYYVYGNIVVVLYEGSVPFGFDYKAANANGGVATKVSTDGSEGVWYLDKTVNDYDEDGNPYSYFQKKYYKLVLDGLGHAAVYYLADGQYRLNWGSGEWGTYTVDNGGYHMIFNPYQKPTFHFYYNKQLAYTTSDRSAWVMGECAFYAEGYTGEMTPPAFPATYVGKYVEGEITLNIRADLTGSYCGYPMTNVNYDGGNKLVFKSNGVVYTATFGESVVVTDGETTVELNKAGAVTEVVPAALVGTWEGVWSGLGASATDVRTIRIEEDGTVFYGAGKTFGEIQLTNPVYDFATNVLTAYIPDSELYFTLTYNPDNDSISLYMECREEGEFKSWTSTLTKQS